MATLVFAFNEFAGVVYELWCLMVMCVCVQVFDNTPAALDGTLAAGDEITGVNGRPVKGKTKVEVAKMIQTVQVCLETTLFTAHMVLKKLYG